MSTNRGMKVSKVSIYGEPEFDIEDVSFSGSDKLVFISNKIGLRWQDYLESIPNDKWPYAEAIREWIINNQVCHWGVWGQEVDFLFSDDTIGRLGPKEWGDLLAAIWSEYDNKDYSYAGFAFLGDDSPMVLSGERMAYRIPNIQKTSGTRDGALVNYEMKKNDSI